MRKLIYILCIGLFYPLSIAAQGIKSSQKIRALKIAYLTEQLDLNSEEAEKFWPIYNAFNKELQQLRKSFRVKIKAQNNLKTISEEEAKKLVVLKLTIDDKINESQKNFIDEVKKVISYQKILLLKVAEREFGRKLMQKYRDKIKK